MTENQEENTKSGGIAFANDATDVSGDPIVGKTREEEEEEDRENGDDFLVFGGSPESLAPDGNDSEKDESDDYVFGGAGSEEDSDPLRLVPSAPGRLISREDVLRTLKARVRKRIAERFKEGVNSR